MIFPIHVRPTFIAPFGQNSWQQKQWMQTLRLICGLPRFIVIALAGHVCAHLPQPIQEAESSFGNGVRILPATKSATLPGRPSPSTWKNTSDCAGPVLKSRA